MSLINPNQSGIKNILSIAGSDPSGGAGIQADLKTFSALGAYGMSVITSLTAQNTTGVRAVEHVSADFVQRQLETVFEDIRVDGVKIGMIGSSETAQIIINTLKKQQISVVVFDPVMVASSGDVLISAEIISMIKQDLFPLCSLITPNAAEDSVIKAYGATAVLKTGGDEGRSECVDILIDKNEKYEFSSPKICTQNTHGTGCTLSSAITVYLAQGVELKEAIERAKIYISKALRHADDLDVGSGHGPVHHFYEAW